MSIFVIMGGVLMIYQIILAFSQNIQRSEEIKYYFHYVCLHCSSLYHTNRNHIMDRLVVTG